MSDDPRLQARVEARKEANEILKVADHYSICLWTSGQKDADAVFWQEIRDYVLTKAPLPPVKPQLIKARPMTDEQAREFEKEEVPFGFHSPRPVGHVPIEYLRWLSNQTFVDDLRRYLANETIARQE